VLSHGYSGSQWFYVGDGEHQDDFTELSILAQRSHGVAERALVVEYDVSAIHR